MNHFKIQFAVFMDNEIFQSGCFDHFFDKLSVEIAVFLETVKHFIGAAGTQPAPGR